MVEKLDVQHVGAIAEQFVAQEYIANSSSIMPASLFYWHRKARTSNAEVDFIFLKQQAIVPTEVKTGSLRSLLIFLAEHEKSTYGLRISEHPHAFDEDHHIETIPLYGMQQWMKD